MSDFMTINIDKANMFAIGEKVRFKDLKFRNFLWRVKENDKYSIVSMEHKYTLENFYDKRILVVDIKHSELERAG